MMSDKFYRKCMAWGKFTGCHQKPERSFFINGRQFPVCARCTGVFAGEIFAFIIMKRIKLPLSVSIIFCVIMLLDWFIQYKGVHSSTNCRRLCTGFICGWGITNIFAFAIKFLLK